MKKERRKAPPDLRVGIDTGGTFTDLVALGPGIRVALKVPSTPEQPERAVLAALDEFARRAPDLAARVRRVVHGSTVATNALLEERGARVALVTNEGFEDLIEIGRQARDQLYALRPSRPEPLVHRRDRIGVPQRSEADGRRSRQPSAAELERLRDRLRRRRPQAVAIGLLHSYLDPDAERELERALEELGLPLCRSSDVAPLFREFERFSTAVANASLLPVVQRYLTRLEEAMDGRDLAIQQSNGGLTSPADAARYPVRLVLSGPSGGVHAAERLLAEARVESAISFDMGGTSTDVGWIQGSAQRTDQISVGGRPLLIDAIEIHTIGAGGGSLVWIDEGGALRVGPQSAGADPGPACYGRGDRPTVTDCHAVLGRLPADRALGECIDIDPERSARALGPLAEELDVDVPMLASRVLDVVDAAMSKAIKHISLERGHDPRHSSLFAFGGAGGLHANRLAAALGMPRVLVPPAPGAISAYGMAVSDARFDHSQGRVEVLGDDAESRLKAPMERLAKAARARLRAELGPGPVELERKVGCRYLGQSYELLVEFGPRLRARFEAAHERRYGFRLDQPLQCVALHATAIRREAPPRGRRRRATPRAAVPHSRVRVLVQSSATASPRARRIPRFQREELRPGDHADGPCVVCEQTSTTLVESGWRFQVGAHDELVLEPRRRAP